MANEGATDDMSDCLLEYWAAFDVYRELTPAWWVFQNSFVEVAAELKKAITDTAPHKGNRAVNSSNFD